MRQLALLACLLFVLYLFRADSKRTDASKALWIPLVWMFLAGSRVVSQWLGLPGPMSQDESMNVYMEGSPLDRFVFSALIVAGVIVLHRRRVSWRQLMLQNRWVWLFFLFGAFTAIPSENPFLSLKRLLKAIGNVVMALLILTDRNPYVTVGVVLRRLAFLTLPISVVFILYFPELGRDYHRDGQTMFTGLAPGKNALGQLCLLAGIYSFWSLLHRPDQPLRLFGPLRIRVEVILLILVAWLLRMADSATSLACLCLAAALLWLSRVPAVAQSPRRIVNIAITSGLVIAVLELTLDVSGAVIANLGRDPSLTHRLPMWTQLLAVPANPLFGAGYEVFWASAQGRVMGEQLTVAQAHNGYLELYLNVGVIGLALALAGMVSGLLKVRHHFSVDARAAILRLCFILVVAIYNWTEATLYGVSNTWLLLFLGILEVPTSRRADRASYTPKAVVAGHA